MLHGDSDRDPCGLALPYPTIHEMVSTQDPLWLKLEAMMSMVEFKDHFYSEAYSN